MDDDLVQRIRRERCGTSNGLVGAHDAAHDLHELHDRHRVEEVHADDRLRPHRCLSDAHDWNRGRVRSKDGVLVRDDVVELAEDVLLQLLVLDNRLDHELTIVHGLEVCAEAEAAERIVAGRLVELSPVDCFRHRHLDPGAGCSRSHVVDLVHDDGDSGLGADLGDSRTHLSAADDADSFDAHADS